LGLFFSSLIPYTTEKKQRPCKNMKGLKFKTNKKKHRRKSMVIGRPY